MNFSLKQFVLKELSSLLFLQDDAERFFEVEGFSKRGIPNVSDLCREKI
jgi:hypothetical protein